jgi:DnaK suppressor protein
MARTKPVNLQAELNRRYEETLLLLREEEQAVQALRDSVELGAGDGVDVASTRVTLDEQVMLSTTLRAQLAELAAAMQRYETGVYGLCDRCHEPIPAARLSIFPASTHCVPCKARLER